MERGKSTGDISSNLSRCSSRTSMRMSTRMKKAAAPPPPNLASRRASSGLELGQQRAVATRQRTADDCAIDERLEGRVDLDILLPDLSVVRLNVDRKTPMMDVLVQASSVSRVPAGGHVLRALNCDERLPPSTPVGQLDAARLALVPRPAAMPRHPPASQPTFEQTFRVSVSLPRGQRTVVRCAPGLPLSGLLREVCGAQGLEPDAHRLVRPQQPHRPLPLDDTLADYGSADIALASAADISDSIRSSYNNITTYPKPEIPEEKKKKGILRLFSRKKKDFSVEASNGSQFLHTSQSDNCLNRSSNYQPKQSLKRKPAPAPPSSSPPLITQSTNSINSRPESEISLKTADEIESSVSHSRHSSDSSGYHEPSVFSDCSENKSPEASIVNSDTPTSDANRQNSPCHRDYPDSGVLMKRSSMTSTRETNLKNVPSCSTASIASASRKRRAPQPPGTALPAIESPASPDLPPQDVLPSQKDAVCVKNNFTILTDDTVSQSSSLLRRTSCPSVDSTCEDISRHPSEKDSSANPAEGNYNCSSETSSKESEAIQYLEEVLQESENSSRNFQRVLDDSDTDSQKDEGEVISICQAEVHANDQDSSDSVVEPDTVVTPEPAVQCKASFVPSPSPQPNGTEAADTSADDSGLSHSLNSDADSSLPSLNSELKALSDSSGCHEELQMYCNVPPGVIIPPVSVISVTRPEGKQPMPLPRMSLRRRSNQPPPLVEENVCPPCDSTDEKTVPSCDELSAENTLLNIHTEKCESPSLENSPNTSPDESTNTTVLTNDKSPSPETVEHVNEVPEQIKSVFCETSTEEQKTSNEPKPSQYETKEASMGSKRNSISSDKISVSSLSSDSARNSVSHTPQPQRKLDNFTLGCYKTNEDIDIYSMPSPEHNPLPAKREMEAPPRKNRNQPEVKIVTAKANHQRESGIASIAERQSQLSEASTLPLTGRSASMANLMPLRSQKMEIGDLLEEETEMKRTISDHNVIKDLESMELKATFRQEQQRLQEEYRRLQEQFLSWQRQLMCNPGLLQGQKIVPNVTFPSLENLMALSSQEEPSIAEETNTVRTDYSLKTMSLPRPKTKPLSVMEPKMLQSSEEPETVSIEKLQKSPQKTKPSEIQQLPDKSAAENSPSKQSYVKQPEVPAEAPTSGNSSKETAQRPVSLSTSVSTEMDQQQEDKVVQVPSPQDKNTQVPSPQDKVTSGTQAPSPETVLNRDTSAQTGDSLKASSPEESSASLSSPESDASKSQTLPRHKPKPISALPPQRTMTLNRATRPKTQTVAVTIGSWQQRQMDIADIEPTSVASSRSKFMSLENIPQNAKPGTITMEKRKLPPVPIEVDSSRHSHQNTLVKTVQAKPETTVQKTVHATIISRPPESIKSDSDRRSVVKPVEDTTVPKQKLEVKVVAKEPSTISKLAKPFIKLTSMKDEPHAPSIIGLKKWPLADISENRGLSDSRMTIVEDLRASSKKPGGFVQEKIRRAEVDLRKPKSSKVETTKPRTDSDESSKVHTNPKTFRETVTAAKTPTACPERPPRFSSNTLPKSQSLNNELKSVFEKKAIAASEKSTTEARRSSRTQQTITVNGSPPPPPPPPPPPLPETSSTGMPTIPPAEQIPMSSQLLISGGATKAVSRKESKRSPTKPVGASDPREELMLEIRGFGGKKALRKAPSAKTGWNLRVYGASSTVNT